MAFQPNDILLAFKHIGLSAELNGTEKQFAIFLIDCYNRKSGRCDPSEQTAAHILRKSTRTIIRAGHRVVAMKLFRKRKHAGNHHCNSYEPNWEVFRELENLYKQRRKQWARRFERPASLSSSPCQPCHSNNDSQVIPKCQPVHPVRDETVTQTSSSNHIEGSCPSSIAPATLSEVIPNPHLPLDGQRRLGNEESGQDAFSRSRGIERMNAARAAAEAAALRRWNSDLHHQFSSTSAYGAIVDAIDLSLQDAATAAEMKQPGSGLAHIREELDRRGDRQEQADPGG